MRTNPVWKLALVPVLALALAGSAAAQSTTTKGLDGPTAFAMLKNLQGAWEGMEEGTGGERVNLVYRVTAKGNVVEETFYRGAKLEMITMYYVDSSRNLRLTHYCAANNRPQMILDSTASTASSAVTGPTKLVFKFAGGEVNPTVDFHMNSGSIELIGTNQLRTIWLPWKGGHPFPGPPTTFARMAIAIDPAF